MRSSVEASVEELCLLATVWGANTQSGDTLAAENNAHEALRVLLARREDYAAAGYGPLWGRLKRFWRTRVAVGEAA